MNWIDILTDIQSYFLILLPANKHTLRMSFYDWKVQLLIQITDGIAFYIRGFPVACLRPVDTKLLLL